jgi:TRAP-type C4-dicarboxylate transport system substrate-binding protein
MRALLLTCVVAAAHADSKKSEVVTLRLASAVPEGTAWARVGKAFAYDVEQLTHRQLRVKWYLGGIAGNELQVLDRIRRDQLDGIGSGGVVCQRLAPTMRVTRLVGLLRSRAESELVLTRLKPRLDEEFHQSGFVNLWEAGLGPSLIFSRTAVRSLGDLKRVHLWTWDLDELFATGLRTVGIPVVGTSLEDAAPEYDRQKLDGYITMPAAALAFQWSAQTHFLTNLPLGFLSGCLLIANRTFDALPVEQQQALRQAAANFQAHMEDVGRQQDQALVEGGLFKRQGLQFVPVTDAFREAFYAAAETARRFDTTVTAELKAEVEAWLKEYRK